ncbi:MAG: nucleotide exchange factor GrpE [Candidatus Lambdaproteobacteria bacterium]|nr:nucleotide exchange factor GrpE [Candidatus Lambdaproteobacteria bacterium]
MQPCAEPAAAAPGPEPALTQELEALRGELEQVQAALQERQDQYLRVQAEFENYKKRFQKEQAEAARYVNLPLLRDLASIMDNMERAVSHAEGPEGQELASFLKGIELVIKQLGDTFEKYGMTRIKTVGAPFDPRRQEAVSVAENDAVPENHVVEEYQPGYVLHERVVRPAMVVVAKRSSESKADEPGSE